jgi:tetratricopeptide (TPR) repeat protein
VKTLAASETTSKVPRKDARLANQLRGDLDWITMKALEKDRTRRYGSVSDLAADLRRHLSNLPVLASPPHTVYRLGRFMRRHRVGVASCATLVALLLAFATTMTVQARRIAHERDRALAAERRSLQEAELAQQVSTFLVDLFKVSDPSEARGNRITAREILDKGSARITRELKDQPAVQGRLMATMGRVYTSLGLFDRARVLLQDALAIRRRTLGDQHPEVAESLDDLGMLLFETGNLGEAERLLRDALALRRRALGDNRLDTASTENHLAMAIRRKETPGANAEAEQLYRSALAARRKVLGADDRAIAESLNDLGLLLLQNQRDYSAAEPLFREALEINRRAFGNEHLEVSITLNNLGLLLRDTGRYGEAESLLREALVIDRHVLGDEHPGVGVVLNNLANLLQRKGDLAGAESFYREALALNQKAFPNRPDEHWEVATIKSLLGGCLTTAKRYADAEPLLLASYPIIKGNFGDNHPRTQVALRRLVDLYDAWGKPAKAKQYRAMLVPPTR